MYDTHTETYFDQYTPGYTAERFRFALDWLQDGAGRGGTLLDVGCGDGSTLNWIQTQTGWGRLAGLDVSSAYMEKTRERVGCEVIKGSILDRELVDSLQGRFDCCTLGAVLHHLVAHTRRGSFQNARLCLEHVVRLLTPGGLLILSEPTFSSSLMMDLVFWIKRSVSQFTSARIDCIKQGANIGSPVISCYTPGQIFSFLKPLKETRILRQTVVNQSRLVLGLKQINVGYVIQRLPAESETVILEHSKRSVTESHNPPDLSSVLTTRSPKQEMNALYD
jgi:SAM-dependent methyltransferase